MKRLFKAAALFLPFVLLIVLVNCYADPANVLRTGYEEQVAAMMSSGQNASNIRNMDDRLFMQQYAAVRTQPVDTLVLGSSHSMQVTSQLTGDPNTFCAGVTGADLRDCISIYRLFREKGFAPKRVILTLDAWFLSEGTLEPRAMTDGYVDFCNEHGLSALQVGGGSGWTKQLTKWGQAISLPYFQSSVEYLKQGKDKTRDPVPSTDYYTASDMRRADGSYCYYAEMRDVTPANADGRAKNYIISTPSFALYYTGLSAELQRQLETFISDMQADGVQVAIMLSPFHTAYYDYMLTDPQEYAGLLSNEQVFREIAQQKGIPLFGSFSPYNCGLVNTDFYDGVHCSDVAVYSFYPRDLFDGLTGGQASDLPQG